MTAPLLLLPSRLVLCTREGSSLFFKKLIRLAVNKYLTPFPPVPFMKRSLCFLPLLLLLSLPFKSQSQTPPFSYQGYTWNQNRQRIALSPFSTPSTAKILNPRSPSLSFTSLMLR